MSSDRFQRLENDGARMQRLLWASTKTKDPAASDTLYVHGLAAPFTVNTMPDDTLKAFFDHGEVGDPMPADGGDADALLARFAEAGVDLGALAAKLQSDGATSFVDAWNELHRAGSHTQTSRGQLPRHRAPTEEGEHVPMHAAAASGPPSRRWPSTTPRSRAGTCASCSPRTRRGASG